MVFLERNGYRSEPSSSKNNKQPTPQQRKLMILLIREGELNLGFKMDILAFNKIISDLNYNQYPYLFFSLRFSSDNPLLFFTSNQY
jgi:hypothetical protein